MVALCPTESQQLAHAQELDTADTLAGFRDRFFFADRSLIYLNGNSLGALPLATMRRLESVIREEWGTALVRSWDHSFGLPERTGDLIGQLIGAAPGQVLVTDNTTVNLYKLACAALAARPGRRVIITDDDNFPSDRYVAEGIAADRGAELRMLPTDRNTGVDPAAIRAAVDGDTALVSLSHVAYRSGALADMAEITNIVHQAGRSCCGTCATPSARCRSSWTHATWTSPSAAPTSTSTPGQAPRALLYVSARLRDVLRQPIWGWFSQRDQLAMGPAYDPAEGMSKFMTGTPNILGTYAVEEGCRLLLQAGMDNVPGQERPADQLSHRAGQRLAGAARLHDRHPSRPGPARRERHGGPPRRGADRQGAGPVRHHHRLPDPGPDAVRAVPAHHPLHRRWTAVDATREIVDLP